jgi:hypothetical protein
MALGADLVDSTGGLKVPAFVVTRAGVITLDLVTASSGTHGYVKVLVVK